MPLKALKERSNLDTRLVGDVVLGCVDPVKDQGGDIARTAVLAAGYDEDVPGVQINRFCASGLEQVPSPAIRFASAGIASENPMKKFIASGVTT